MRKDIDKTTFHDLGISEIQKGLYTAEVMSSHGEKFYIAYEEITCQEQLDFWNQFKKTLQKKGGGYILFAWLFNDVSRNEVLPTYPQSYSAAFESEEAYNAAVEKVKRSRGNGKGYNSLLIDLAKDALPFFSPKMSTEDECNYVVYASKVPILDFRYKKPMKSTIFDEHVHEELNKRNKSLGHNYKVDNLAEVLDFIANYSDILMCYGAHTTLSSWSVTHMGIFRNPLSLLDPDDLYRDISLIVHGLGALIAHLILKKEFLVFAPIPNMQNILFRFINKSAVVNGYQKDWEECVKKHFSDKQVPYPDNLKSLLPLYHQEAVEHGILMLLDLDLLEPFYNNARPDFALRASGGMQNK